jgi:hypothetical protein
MCNTFRFRANFGNPLFTFSIRCTILWPEQSDEARMDDSYVFKDCGTHIVDKPIVSRQSDREDRSICQRVYFMSIVSRWGKKSRCEHESVSCHLVFLHTWMDVTLVVKGSSSALQKRQTFGFGGSGF